VQQKTLQDNESFVEMASEREPQNSFLKAEVGSFGPTPVVNGFQSPYPRIASKFNNDLISE
jgi:hypothetical protein